MVISQWNLEWRRVKIFIFLQHKQYSLSLMHKKKVDCDVRLRFSHYLGNIQILVMAFPNLITDKSMQE